MAGSMPQGTNIPVMNAQYLGGVAPSTPPTYNFTYDEARSRMMQRDVKSPAESAAIQAALKAGPSTGMPAMRPSDSLGFSNGALPSPRIMSNTPTGMPAQPQQPNIYQQASEGVTKAMQGAQAGMGFTPMAITAPTQQAIGQYMNPYESQVVGQSLADIERSRQMAQNVGGAQASAARAFGGSRHGIAEAETNRAALEQAARTASSLRQSGFTQAQQLARQAQMQNQAAQLSGAQQRLSAGAQLGSLANLGFGMGQQIQDRMAQEGALQQALQQQLINAAKSQYAGYTGAPAQSLQYLLQAIGASPSPTTTTGTTNRGLFDYLALALGR